MSVSAQALSQIAAGIASGDVKVVDLTQTLSEDTPTLVLPPPFGQCAPFSRQEISRYDERGVAWYWSNFTVGEHTGTHFDAPAHWVTGKDQPAGTVDVVPPSDLIAPAVVIDCSAEAAADPDFLLEPAHIEAWEAVHGRIPPRSWVLFRTDWSKRDPEAYVNRREDGAHTPDRRPPPSACWSKSATLWASASKPSARTLVRLTCWSRPTPPTPFSTGPAAMVCSAYRTWTPCRLRAPW
ncbi:cyclase family protein [Brevundimonas sp. LF-1]|uniref:cyclase family protein n=1 Tax=Brevundimonas sp. LF-1 TaxID=3126100 RepID=UPI0030E59B7F